MLLEATDKHALMGPDDQVMLVDCEPAKVPE